MFISNTIFVLMIISISGCSSKPIAMVKEERAPASRETLESILTPFTDTFSRPVKLYSWGKGISENPSAYGSKHINAAWKKSSKIFDAAGKGLYGAIDPTSSKKFGPELLVIDIPVNFRYLKAEEIPKEILMKLGQLNLIPLLMRGDDRRSNLAYRKAFRALGIQAIRYSFDAHPLSLRQYAFVIVDSSSEVTFSSPGERIAKRDYAQCVKNESCAISTGDYAEDRSSYYDNLDN